MATTWQASRGPAELRRPGSAAGPASRVLPSVLCGTRSALERWALSAEEDGCVTVRYLSGEVERFDLGGRCTAELLRTRLAGARGVHQWQVQLLRGNGEPVQDE
ncbi:unnamed protein product, partial [Prorocentrum cordatum]